MVTGLRQKGDAAAAKLVYLLETAQEPDPAVREAFIADAKKTYENTPALKKDFADFDAYLAALDKAA